MGLLDRLLRRTPDRPTPTPQATPARGFAVIDLETTGFVPARERVVEVAVVHVDPDGAVGEAWSTLVHPGRSGVGPTHVHGITAADVRNAPLFEDVASAVVHQLAGRVLVAHNAAFDLPFLHTELARAGVAMPDVPHLCTLAASSHHLPRLSRRRLTDCCDAVGIALDGAHAALADASATAALLAWYLHAPTHDARWTQQALERAAAVAWPVAPTATGARLPRPRRPLDETAPEPAAPGRLAEFLADLPLDAPDLPLPEAAGYLEALAAAMADGVLTDAEVDALVQAATSTGLTRRQVHAAHRGVLLALAATAAADGVVTATERADLLATAVALGLDATEVGAALDEATTERIRRLSTELAPLPAGWDLGEPLRLGDAVVFTGGDDAVRARLERRTRDAGLRVVSAVSRRTAVLVTEDVGSGTGKARRALELGTRVLDAATYGHLLDHVQPPPAPPNHRTPSPRRPAAVVAPPVEAPQRPERGPEPDEAIDLRPAEVRAWGRARGIDVSDRGRLPQAVLDAYAAHTGSERA